MLRTLEEKVDPNHAALIVVDVENDFCHDDSPFARIKGSDMSAAQEMVPRLVKLIDAARAAGVLVIFTRDPHSAANVSEVQREQWLRSNHRGMDPNLEPWICREGSWGEEFYLVSPQPEEPIIRKHRYSAFIGTDLDLILRSKGIRSLIMTGVASSGCVASTARGGFMHDYYIVFVSNCSASFSVESHEAALANISDIFGVVVTSDEIMNIWGKIGARKAVKVS